MPLIGSRGAASVRGFGSLANLGYFLRNSLRFRSSASAYLNRTFTTSTNNKIWTYSAWIKLSDITGDPAFMGTTDDNTANGNFGVLRFSAGQIQIVDYAGGYRMQLLTTARYRDPAAWYHVVIAVDTTQATSTDRVKLYVNGSQVTAFSTSTYPSQNLNTFINSATANYLGGYYTSGVGPSSTFNGYFAELRFIDGQQLTPSSFGSTNAYGIWQPIPYTGTYGTNGFYLPFTDNSALTTSSNVGLGKDFSGNSNYWTTNNISITSGSTYDSMTDVPTLTSATAANYAVMNPLDKGSDITLSNANLSFTGSASASGWRAVRGTIGFTSGKWRFSVYGTVGFSSRMNFGFATAATDIASYFTSQNIGVQYNPYDGAYYIDGAYTSYGTTYRSTYTFDFLVDADNKKVWVAVNGTLLGGNPDAGTGQMVTFTNTGILFPVFSCYGGNWDVNFGQRPFDYSIATASQFLSLNTFNI